MPILRRHAAGVKMNHADLTKVIASFTKRIDALVLAKEAIEREIVDLECRVARYDAALEEMNRKEKP